MQTPGKMVTCDRCGAKHFARMLEEKKCERDGGWTKWMEREFEELPAGWSRKEIGDEFRTRSFDLCPECSEEFEAMRSRFIGDAENN